MAAEALEERALDALLDGVLQARQRHGPASEEAAHATALCESELERWQRAAAEDDGANVERLFSTIERVLDALRAPAAPAAPQPGAAAPAAAAAAGVPPPPAAKGPKGGRRRPRRRSPDAQAASGASDDAFAQAAWPAPAPAFGAGPGAGVAAGPQGVEDPFGAFPAAPFGEAGALGACTAGPGCPAEVAGSFGAFPATPCAAVAPCWPSQPRGGFDVHGPCGGMHEPALAPLPGPPSEPGPPASERGPDESAGRGAFEAIKDEEIRFLQAELDEARLQLQRQAEQLQKRAADEESADNSSAASLRRLRAEAEGLRDELRGAREQLRHREEQLCERDEQLSETRQRLFEEKRRSGQLESQLLTGEAARLEMEERFDSERAARQAAEREAERLRMAIRHGHRALLSGDAAGGPSRRGSVRHDARAPSAPPGGAGVRREAFAAAAAAHVPAARALAPAPLPKVSQQDELASSEPGGASAHRAGPQQCGDAPGGGAEGAGAAPPPARAPLQVPAATLPWASASDWRRAPRASRPEGALLRREPPAPRGCAEQVATNYRKLLTEPRGRLYEDEHVSATFSLTSTSVEAAGSFCCSFELVVAASCGQGHPGGGAQEVCLEPAADALPRQPSVRLLVEPVHGPRGSAAFRGRLEALSPYEASPQVDLSYLLPDGLRCRARFRLPLPVSRLLEPAPNISASQFQTLWCSPEFARAEFCCVCDVQPAFLAPGGLYWYAKGLELRGLLASLPGFDGAPHSVALATLFRPFSGRASGGVFPGPEILVRAELGGPSGKEAVCRLTVRSGSHLLNRGLARVLLDTLCGPA